MDTFTMYHESAGLKRPAARTASNGIRTALAKRARLSQSNSASLDKVSRPSITAADAVELCSELLKRAGRDPNSVSDDPDLLARLLEQDYSPKIAEVFFRLVSSLDASELQADISRRDSSSLYKPGGRKGLLYDSGLSESDGLTIPGSDDFHKFGNNERGEEDTVYNDQLIPEVSSITAFKPNPISPHRKPEVEHLVVPRPKPEPLVHSKLHVEETAPGKAYNKDTEIALSRIFDLGKVATVADPSIPPFAPYNGPSVVSMSGFGDLGRFGNQILQYAFLRMYASRHNISEVQVPGWVGAGLFGLHDRPVQRALPAAIEYRDAKANSTFTTEFMDYITASNAGREVAHVGPSDLSASANSSLSPVNVDFWGWFQWHTSHFASYKLPVQQIFRPVPQLESHLSEVFNRELRFRGGKKHTVVGLHLRLGDYQNISASSFGYCAPTSWYLQWLAKVWPTLVNPVLFVASDDLDAVLRDFAAYNPQTADMIGLQVPDSMRGLKAGFFPDWWSLTQCDVLAISNSTFSFTACMMNERPDAQFYRAHYADRMVAFDPWNSEPIVHRDMGGSSLNNALSTLKVVYNTQGTRGLMRNVLYELPYYGIRAGIMKAVLWREAQSRRKLMQPDSSALRPVST